MKKLFALVAVLLAVCIVPNDVDAQTRKEKKASKKATEQSRGTKLVREECEELAMDITAANPRAAGNGVSANEMLATNMAMLDARSNLAQQLEVFVNGMIETFNQQYASNGNTSLDQKNTQVQRAYFEKILSNTRPIKKNTYLKEDGSYNVYVCIEMDPNLTKAVFEQLKNDKMLHIDIKEDLFKAEMDKARKLYLENLDK